MTDDNERDEKIIAVHAKDPRFDKRKNINDFSKNVILEIKHFFETYKQLQGKKVKILSIKGPKDAEKEIKTAIKKYKKEFIDIE
jgi:inorganic pyrophosphatase